MTRGGADSGRMPETEKTARARAEVNEFVAAHLPAPWKAQLPFPSAPPSTWAVSVEWSVRCALCVFAGMVYATHPDLQDKSWVAAPLFTPVIAVAIKGFCAPRCLGSVMGVSKAFLSGSLLGAVCAMISCELARLVGDAGQPSQDRDLIMYLLSAIFFTWFCTRTNLSPPQKKLACAIYALSVGAPTLNDYPDSPKIDWLYPMKLLLTCTFGGFLPMVTALGPFPRPMLAVNELKIRARYHADLVRASCGSHRTERASPVHAQRRTLTCGTSAGARRGPHKRLPDPHGRSGRLRSPRGSHG